MEQGTKPNPTGPAERFVVPNELPVLPLMNTVVYPNMVAPLLVQRQRSLRCIDEAALHEPKVIGLFAQKAPGDDEPTTDSLHRVGTAGLLLQMLKMPDGGARIIVRGLERIRLVETLGEDPLITARVEPIEETVTESVELQALTRTVI